MTGKRTYRTYRDEELRFLDDRPPEFRAEMQRLLDGDRHFSVEEMARRGWCVAAIEDSIADSQAEGVAAAAARREVKSAIGGTTESEEETFEITISPDAIAAFDMNGLLRYCLLVAERRFAILIEANYYWLLAGPADFIEEALGAPPRILLDRFLTEYADGVADKWPPRTIAMLREMERYRVLC